jgi:hypothetical protein
MGMLVTGLNAVREIRPDPSKHSLLRAVIHLKSLGYPEKADELAKFIKRNWPPKKSKTRPKTGDVRMYSVLCQDTINYARIPMESLGAARGDTVQAVFEEDKITLRHVKFEPMRHAEARAKKPKRKPMIHEEDNRE